jgi:hypothetical protein
MKIDCAERRALLPELGQDGGHFTVGENEQILGILGATPEEVARINERSMAEHRDSLVIYCEAHEISDCQPLLPCAPRSAWDNWHGNMSLLEQFPLPW